MPKKSEKKIKKVGFKIIKMFKRHRLSETEILFLLKGLKEVYLTNLTEKHPMVN